MDATAYPNLMRLFQELNATPQDSAQIERWLRADGTRNKVFRSHGEALVEALEQVILDAARVEKLHDDAQDYCNCCGCSDDRHRTDCIIPGLQNLLANLEREAGGER